MEPSYGPAQSLSSSPSMRQWPNILTILLSSLLIIEYFAPFADSDYTWQIRTGELIHKTGSLRPPESFSYTLFGNQVPDYEWLYEYCLYWIWTCFGYGGLKLLKILLITAPLAIVMRWLAREGVRWYGIGTAILCSIAVLTPAWNLRPLYCTTIGLLLLSSWLHQHCHGKPLSAWKLPLLMLIWANSHPGVIAGQGILAGAIAWEWINRWLNWNRVMRIARIWRLTLVGGAGIAASFLSPNPIDRMLFPFSSNVAHSAQRIFVEMQPSYRYLVRGDNAVAIVYILAILTGITWIVRFRQYRLWEIAYLCTLACLANVAVRGLQDWLYGLLSLGLPQIGLWARDRAILRRRGPLFRIDRFLRHVLETRWFLWQPGWMIVVLGLLAFISLVPPLGRQMPRHDAMECPTQALSWMQQNQISGRIFSPPDYGSYVGWKLGPGARCYVDTRGFTFPGSLIEDSHYLPQLAGDWPARLERVMEYGTDYFFLEATGSRGELWRTLKPWLEPLYEDNQAVLLNADNVRQAALRYLSMEQP